MHVKKQARKEASKQARKKERKKESRTRLAECPSFKGKVFGSNPNVFNCYQLCKKSIIKEIDWLKVL